MPFRKLKNSAYEGGIATPFIACWPDGIKSQAGKWSQTPYHLIDMMATFAEIAGANYPKTYAGSGIIPTEGISTLPAFKSGVGPANDYFYWEHEGNCAIRHGDWKAVKRLPKGA